MGNLKKKKVGHVCFFVGVKEKKKYIFYTTKNYLKKIKIIIINGI